MSKTRTTSIYVGELGPMEIVYRTCADRYVGTEAVLGDGHSPELVEARILAAVRLVQAGMKYHHIAVVMNKNPRTVRWYLNMDKQRERKRR